MAVLLPPPQYDVPPPMPVIEYVLPWSEVQRICFDHMAKLGNQSDAQTGRQVGFDGCASFGKAGTQFAGKCYIWRIDDVDVARHERAHCAGWPANHPGGWRR
jgi:hypothetical protein